MEHERGSTCDPSIRANPHFDHDRVVWDDSFSGMYQPVPYEEQFDAQWRLFLERRLGFCRHTGVETDDAWIDERIEELTGVSGFIERAKAGPLRSGWRRLWRELTGRRRAMGIGGRLELEPKFPIDFWEGKRCLDVGCGAGRWTRALLALGASVTSSDVSEHALESVRRFNPDVRRLDLFSIVDDHPDLLERYEFTLCWGVVMCTHDPRLAFSNVAATVAPGGSLYMMVYAPTYHASDKVCAWRRHYHRELTTFEERLEFAYRISDRPENAINQLDMLNTFYNWTIPEDTVHRWYADAGFVDVVTLNRAEVDKAAYHVVGRRAS